MNLDGYDAERYADRMGDGPDGAELDLPERWILSRVQRATEAGNNALDEYRISDAAQAAYHFIWDEVCDWYIELAKARLGKEQGGEERWKVQGALVTALETAMRLLHPFMPFITEEIWQQLPKPSGTPQSIMITLYPVRDVRFHDDASEASMALVQKIIAEQARCGEVRVRRSGASFSGEFVLNKTAMAMGGDVEVMVPLEGLVDPNAEREKLLKD